MRKASDFHSVGSRNVRHFENTSMLFIQDCHAKLFPRYHVCKIRISQKRKSRKKDLCEWTGVWSAERKKNPEFCKTNDCVMRNYNAFMPLRESKSSEPPKLTKTKTNQFKG